MFSVFFGSEQSQADFSDVMTWSCMVQQLNACSVINKSEPTVCSIRALFNQHESSGQ